jgi:hypothetical protein
MKGLGIQPDFFKTVKEESLPYAEKLLGNVGQPQCVEGFAKTARVLPPLISCPRAIAKCCRQQLALF